MWNSTEEYHILLKEIKFVLEYWIFQDWIKLLIVLLWDRLSLIILRNSKLVSMELFMLQVWRSVTQWTNKNFFISSISFLGVVKLKNLACYPFWRNMIILLLIHQIKIFREQKHSFRNFLKTTDLPHVGIKGYIGWTWQKV